MLDLVSEEESIPGRTVVMVNQRIKNSEIYLSQEHWIDLFGTDDNGQKLIGSEYDIYFFSDGLSAIRGRSFTSEPDTVSFQAIETHDNVRSLCAADLESTTMLVAINYLRKKGKVHFKWLDPSNEMDGYLSISPP